MSTCSLLILIILNQKKPKNYILDIFYILKESKIVKALKKIAIFFSYFLYFFCPVNISMSAPENRKQFYKTFLMSFRDKKRDFSGNWEKQKIYYKIVIFT